MPRVGRLAKGGVIYHVLNRGNGRQRLFHKEADLDAFVRLLAEVRRAVPVRLLAWCLMPNHWHLVLWPSTDGQLGPFLLRLCTAHVRRHHAHYHNSAGGHLYQGRYKSFPVQEDHHFLAVCRYVEANALRAGLCKTAQAYRWSSLWAASRANAAELRADDWPVPRPKDWNDRVNAAWAEDELESVRTSVKRGRPFGDEQWMVRTARRLGLEFTLRPRGRPAKQNAAP